MWRPGAADSGAAWPAALLQENERPAACAAGAAAAGAASAKWPGKAGEAPQRAHSASGVLAREFGTVVDGSGAPGGLAVEGAARPAGAQGGPRWRLGLDQRRKRPADASVYVDEEFREERQQGRPAPPALAAAPQPGAPAGGAPEAASARGAPSGDRAPRPPSADLHGEDEGSDEDADMEGKENQPRSSESGACAAVLEHHRALREITLDQPPANEDPPFSDADSSSGGSDFQSENLAEQLAERVRLNADGWYDFKVYVDP